MLFSETLGAGQSIIIGGGKHGQLFILDCSNSEGLDVKFKGTDIPAFRVYKGVPVEVNYRNAVITNPHATDVTFKIYCAPVGVLFSEGRNVEAGPTSILGTVGIVGQPLSSDGGTITPLGNELLEVESIASTTQELIAAASNTNGLIIRTLMCIVAASTPVIRIRASNGVKDYYIGRYTVDTEFKRELYIPADYQLYCHTSSGTAHVYGSYDLL